MIQPDNNIDIILDAFSKNKEIPLVFMGNWSNSVYGLSLKQKYKNKENIILVEAIYDQNILNVFRSNCYAYIHGHSAGGTNPSLVEAMNLSLPIIAYDCNFNRYTTENNCIYFSSSKDLKYKLSLTQKIEFEKIKRKMKSIAKKRYNWNKISDKYLQILRLGKLND